METKHTPGDWQYEPGDDGDRSVGMPGYSATVFTSNDECDSILLATVHEPHYSVMPENDEDDGFRTAGTAFANGVLMSAAPDLLAACEAALNVHDIYSSDTSKRLTDVVADKLRAAIAKAKGEA